MYLEFNLFVVLFGMVSYECGIKVMDVVYKYLFFKYGLYLNVLLFVMLNDDIGFVICVY